TNERPRLLRFRDWQTQPAEAYQFLEYVRSSAGEARWLIQAPAALFEAYDYSDVKYDDRPSEQVASEALFCGLMAIAIAAGWAVELFASGGSERLLIAEERYTFECEDASRRRAFAECVREFS
ncbi:MAG: hypothetical protein Q8S13_10840, partial [Dehalococcoidia bacterium]|nr:hypothetical protein [Dehalococcoidia bacterium]